MIEMNLLTLHVISGLVSAVSQMAGTVIVLFCVISFFSFKPGGSTRFFYLSLIYYFVSCFIFVEGAILLNDISGLPYILMGVSALLMAALINFSYGVLIVILYIRTVVLV
jgi:hypothetical protein